MVRLILVDDHELIRIGLRRILECDESFRVIAEANNGQEALELIKTLQPDVVIADYSMPKMDGLALLREIRAMSSKIRVILLTVENQRETLEKCIEAGADGYILKESAGQEIHRAIHCAMSGDNYIDPTLVSMLFGRIKERKQFENPFNELSHRELEILSFMVKGLSNREISQAMYLAEKTIKNHTTSIFKKLQVKDRVNAVLFAVEHQFDMHYQPHDE